jgi:predicted ribosomally synthesized peptide with SipW-like signal peptide
MVNKKKLTAGVAALILCITGVTYGTLAYFTDKDTRANVITIGHVTGTLTETDEHMRDDNTTGKDYTNVNPGDVLDKDPTVTLDKESEDAYVRVNINYEGLTKEQALAIENNLDISAGWTKSEDGYYYYNEILSNKTGAINSSKVFSKVTIPTEWGNEIAGITFNINVKAEFIQSDNFTPVTDEAGNITGWGNVAIEKSLK